MTAGERVVAATARLVAAGCVAADEEAAAFTAAAPDDATLEGWLRRREDGEPPAWILGTTTFAGTTVRVAPGVYVPRPQTEALVARAAAALPVGGRAVDLCTGSGAVAVALRAAVPGALVVGVDLAAAAVACARSNGVPAVRADVATVPLAPGRWDVVTAVAPYVPSAARALLPADVQRHEPATALDGGADGLVVVRLVVAAAAALLRPGGVLLLELGGDQADALEPALRAGGFTDVEPWHDDDGDLRGVAARRAGRSGGR